MAVKILTTQLIHALGGSSHDFCRPEYRGDEKLCYVCRPVAPFGHKPG